MHRLVPLLLLPLLAACATQPPQGSTPYAPSPAMRAVLEERQAMHAKEMSDLSPAEARDVPGLIDAARAIPNVKGLPATYPNVPQVTPLTASGADTELSARLYRPALAKDTPVIIYYPGGTWATGSLDTYDETARQLAMRTGWVVVSIRTRLAPEAQFPVIHDDAFAAYSWARAHMREWGADPTRVALVGEGPGANLALATALTARDRVRQGTSALPDQLVLVTPVAGTGLSSPSMSENRRSLPLTRATVSWAQDLYARRALKDPRIDLVNRPDLAGLPPTTVILAQIDPLRSGGEALARNLAAAGVPTEARLFPGTTYDFFGLANQVPEAAAAEDYVVNRLKAAFDRPAFPVLSGPVRRVTPPRAARRRAGGNSRQ